MARFESFFVNSIGGIASVLTIMFAWHQCADITTPAGRFVLVSLLALIALLLILLLTGQVRNGRRLRYAETISSLNQVFLDVQVLGERQHASPEEIQTACVPVVNMLADLLSLVTGTRCSACVKVIERAQAGVRPKVVTLCRDHLSRTREQEQHDHSDRPK